MSKTYKALALLLSYPEKETQDEINAISEALENENLLPKSNLNDLKKFIDYFKSTDLLVLQEEYVSLFDRNRTLSLHLFEHVHGESRDRGQAMVDLAGLYAEKGLEVSAKELPDHIPLFLEFLSILSESEAKDFLAQPIDIIAAISARLKKQKNIYAAIFSAIESLSSSKAKKIDEEKVIDIWSTNEQLDKEWEEPQVTFLGAAAPTPKTCGSGSCGGCGG